MKIVFFGDSLTQGTVGINYVDKVAKALRGHHFYNEGVNGDTSLNLFRRVRRDVIDKRPDGVFIMVGVNDAASFVEPNANIYFRLLKRIPGGRVSPISFRENLRAILTALLFENITVWVALPPAEYRPEMVTTLRQMNDYAAELCAELNVPTLNLLAKIAPKNIPARPPIKLTQYAANLGILLGNKNYDAMRDAGGFSYSFDGTHLTENGAQRIANEIVRFLRNNGVSG
jgi:lysophospholipase L1-like esterase